ncbi:MAG TPA: hypothetical protein VFF78_05130 [Anaerolineaceae bacterium]|nr:hypothetical protein [Anaerolineaceae bacterium]
MMKKPLEIGRLLRASTTGCVVGCRVTELDAPEFGGMVRIPLAEGQFVYGLIYDIHIDDDGLVRQLVTAENISEEIILDNRVNRNVPAEISVLFIGHERAGAISHLMPPRPPLTLDQIFTCSEEEVCRFTSAGRMGYFRHILRASDLPLGELLAAHLKQSAACHSTCGDPNWGQKAAQELITLLRDDYNTLMNVLNAIADV